MNNTNFIKPIWLGGLPIGRDWDAKYTLDIVNSLSKEREYIFDLADIYSNGKALKIIIDISKELPSNIKISFKYGLKSENITGFFKVYKREYSNDFSDDILRIFEKIGFQKIHSFQLHALPDKDKSIENLKKSIIKIKKSLKYLKIGISNIEVNEFKYFIKDFPIKFDLIQIHANILEQRLLNEFCKNFGKNYKFIINRSLARGLLTNPNRFIKNNRSRYSTSPRVRKSLTKEKLNFLNLISEYIEDKDTSIERVAYSWFSTFQFDIDPIIGSRTKKQLISSLQILNSITSQDIKIAQEISLMALKIKDLSPDKLPAYALEL